jgi:FdhD protein
MKRRGPVDEAHGGAPPEAGSRGQAPGAALRVADPAPPARQAAVELGVERWRHGAVTRERDWVAEEIPVAFVYHGVPHAVMLATPADLEDYAVGFTLTEGLVASPQEIRGVEVAVTAESAEVRVSVAWERFSSLLDRRRNLTGRTGCGLCGEETVEQAVRELKPVGPGIRLGAAELHQAISRLGSLQPINARTGSVHAAAWLVPGQGIQLVREDVGRHNALDKAVGAVVRRGADPAAGALLLTSRASFEMVQKSASVGVTLVAAFSAPTAFAIRVAERAGVTLVAFAREHQHVVYTHPWRLEPA